MRSQVSRIFSIRVHLSAPFLKQASLQHWLSLAIMKNPLRGLVKISPLLWVGLMVTLTISPALIQPLGTVPAETIAFVGIFLLPGLFCLRFLFPASADLGLVEFPIAFAFSLGLFVVPAVLTNLLQAPWELFIVGYLLILGIGGVLYANCLRRGELQAFSTSYVLSFDTLILIVLVVLTAIATYSATRNGDDWLYLGIVQQRLHQTVLEPIYTGQSRDTIRYMLEDWLFLQAFAERWIGFDPVHFMQDFLPPLLAPLSLLGLYGFAATLLKDRRRD